MRKEETLIENHTPTLLFKKTEIHREASCLRTLKIMPRNLNKLYVHEFCFWSDTIWCRVTGMKHDGNIARRRITVTSSFYETSTDQLGNTLWWWGGGGVTARPRPFSTSAFRQKFKDDVKDFSSSSVASEL
jgi:hypothetical protein